MLLLVLPVSPQGAVLPFIQAGEAAVQASDLTVGDWREDTGRGVYYQVN